MDLRRLSVVVPTHDTRDITLRCLAALADGAAGGAEVVLVDDGSGDGTGEAVGARHPSIRIVRHDQALGFTASANDGLRSAGGDVLLLLNSDTEVEPGTLERLMRAFEEDPRLGVASPLLRNPDGSPQWSGGAAPTRLWLLLLATGLPAALGGLPGYRRLRPVRSEGGGDVDWVTGAAMAIRREAWEQTGPLDASFRFYVQDLDFCLRARDAGWRVRLVPEARVVHLGGASIGRRPGSVRRSAHPGLLWTDLLRWAEKRHGRRWAARAARLVSLGGGLRVAARTLAKAFLGEEQRAVWEADTAAFRLALAEVRRWSEGTSGSIQ
jgi:GT2 family glycosyltransferase